MKTKRCNATKLLVYQWKLKSGRPDPGINAAESNLRAYRPVASQGGGTNGAC